MTREKNVFYVENALFAIDPSLKPVKTDGMRFFKKKPYDFIRVFRLKKYRKAWFFFFPPKYLRF